MKITSTALDGVLIVETDVFGDNRGFFTESYNQQKFNEAGIEFNFIQDNHSLSQEAGTLRGMHYQLSPKAQTKLVRVLSGAIYDVVIDLRKNSSTYGNWQGFILSDANKRQLLVPKGFAHGFCTLTAATQVLYKVDEYYSKEHDRGIRWDDPALAIDWPTANVILSEKDKIHPGFNEAEHDF